VIEIEPSWWLTYFIACIVFAPGYVMGGSMAVGAEYDRASDRMTKDPANDH
jgi:hypothetical protein